MTAQAIEWKQPDSIVTVSLPREDGSGSSTASMPKAAYRVNVGDVRDPYWVIFVQPGQHAEVRGKSMRGRLDWLLGRWCLSTRTAPRQESPAEMGTSSDAGVSTLPILRKLMQLTKLGADWDSYGAKPITPTAIDVAQRVVKRGVDRFGQLVFEQALPYAVVPSPDGGVQLEWLSGDREFDLDIAPDGGQSYLLVEGEGAARRYIEGEIASEEELKELIWRVISLPRMA